MNNPIGATWNKWDLHIHSPQTFLNNNFANCSIDEFVNAIVTAGIKAVGLTNYFRFGENELESIKQQLNNQGVVVFPNLEFRTQPPNRENDEMHIHVIFSDLVPVAKIQNFLGRLKTVDNKYCNSLTPQEIENTSLTFDILVETLEQDKELKHFEDYLMVACPRGYGNFRPESGDGRGNNMAIVIDKGTDILFGNSSDTEFFLKNDRYPGAEPKPVVCCSDAHDLVTIGTASTWIKADLTFEGLKQVLWEPDGRVRIQERDPKEEKPDRIVIEKLKYLVDGVQQEVNLNPDLNSIIGIRGSGKSTLLKNIAFKVDQTQFEDKDDKRRIYFLDSFEVFWGDGQKDNGIEESPKSIFYIPQNYLSLLAYEETGKAKERDDFMVELLKRNVQFAKAIQQYGDFVSANRVKIESLIEQLLSANQQYREAIKIIRKKGSRAEIEEEIKKLNENIKNYKGSGVLSLTEEEVTDYTSSREIVVTANKLVSILNQDKAIIDKLLGSGAEIYISNQEISQLSSERQSLIRNELNKQGKENLIKLVQEESEKIKQEIENKTKLIETHKKVIDKLREKIKVNKTFEKMSKELNDLQQTFQTITDLESKISELATVKQDSINKLVESHHEYELRQEAVFSSIEFEEEFSFLHLDIVTYYDSVNLEKFIVRNINTVTTSPKLNDGDSDIKNLFDEIPNKPKNETIHKFIQKLIDGEIELKVNAVDLDQVLSQLLRDRFEIDFLNSVTIKEDGTPFKNMTGGQKAITMLELIFKFDNERYPILIDQPEDDLDVSGIATDLVNFIKDEKRGRQIIIVSHNGSLVVCADSEQVICSESQKISDGQYNFSYTTGAIENLEMRSHIIDILEGGADALKQRARKLNFKHLV